MAAKSGGISMAAAAKATSAAAKENGGVQSGCIKMAAAKAAHRGWRLGNIGGGGANREEKLHGGEIKRNGIGACITKAKLAAKIVKRKLSASRHHQRIAPAYQTAEPSARRRSAIASAARGARRRNGAKTAASWKSGAWRRLKINQRRKSGLGFSAAYGVALMANRK